MEPTKKVKKLNVPHIFIIILFIILFACLATYIATPGVYDMNEAGQAIAEATMWWSANPYRRGPLC